MKKADPPLTYDFLHPTELVFGFCNEFCEIMLKNSWSFRQNGTNSWSFRQNGTA